MIHLSNGFFYQSYSPSVVALYSCVCMHTRIIFYVRICKVQNKLYGFNMSINNSEDHWII